MTKNWKTALGSAVLSLSMIGVGAAVTSSAQAQSVTPPANGMRDQYWSNHSLHHARVRLEGVIDNLQRDRHDYDGQREQALDLLQQARQHLLLAEQYEAQHPTNY